MKESSLKPDNEYEIDITPDVSLFEKLGHGQHEIEDAIAELTDNSVDARTQDQLDGKDVLKVTITAPLTHQKQDTTASKKYAKYIEVEDNASGMTKEIAQNCLVIARTNRDGEKQGRFGLGIKQSCLSIGKKFTITTKAINSNKRYVLEYDNEKFKERKSWGGFILKEIIDPSDWHGTIIRIEDFWNEDLIYYNTLNIKLLTLFSFTFGPFIQNNQLELYINDGSKNRKVEPKDLRSECDEQLVLDINIPLEHKLIGGKDVKVYGWVGFLKKKGSTQGFSGFNLYRNFRLIKQWEHIGYKYHAELRKLVGELHLNDFPVTIDKKDFIRNSSQWAELVGDREVDPRGYPLGEYEGGKLAQFIKPLLRKYKSKDQIDRKERKIEKVLKEKEGVQKELEDLEKKNLDPDFSKVLAQTLKSAKTEISSEDKEDAEDKKVDKDETAEQEHQRLKMWKDLVYNTFLDERKIKINDTIYQFDLKTEHAGTNKKWYRHIIRDNKIIVAMNLDYEFILELRKDFDVIVKIVTLMGLSEAITEIKEESKELFLEHFNKLLQLYSQQSIEKREKLELKEDLATLEKKLKNKQKHEIVF